VGQSMNEGSSTKRANSMSVAVGILRLRPDFASLCRSCAQDDNSGQDIKVSFGEVTL